MSSAIEWIWDINDADLVEMASSTGSFPTNRCKIQDFEMWPNGNSRLMYTNACESARRHLTGWAMRNTNNHNAEILKKSCLGVLVCSKGCAKEGRRILIRPAICDIARKKQLGLPCPNPECDGRIVHLPCKGNGGYPVTHFWRQINKVIFFQAKGAHDHPRPEFKTARKMTNGGLCKRAKLTEVGHGIGAIGKPPSAFTITEFTSPKLKSKKRSAARLRKAKDAKLKLNIDLNLKRETEETTPSQSRLAPGKHMMAAVCSCPPFECICKMQRSEHEFWNRFQQQAQQAQANTAALANRMFFRSLSCDTKPLMHVSRDNTALPDFYSPQFVSSTFTTAGSGNMLHNAAGTAFNCYQDRSGVSPHSNGGGYSDDENNRAYFRQNSAPLNAYMNWLHCPDYLMHCANTTGQFGMQLYAMDDRTKAMYQSPSHTNYGNNNNNSACNTPSSPICPVVRYPMHLTDNSGRTTSLTAPYFPINSVPHYAAEQLSM